LRKQKKPAVSRLAGLNTTGSNLQNGGEGKPTVFFINPLIPDVARFYFIKILK